jgi:hypothetical protein
MAYTLYHNPNIPRLNQKHVPQNVCKASASTRGHGNMYASTASTTNLPASGCAYALDSEVNFHHLAANVACVCTDVAVRQIQTQACTRCNGKPRFECSSVQGYPRSLESKGDESGKWSTHEHSDKRHCIVSIFRYTTSFS